MGNAQPSAGIVSGGHRPAPSRGGVVSPVVLRLLPHVPHPPARVGFYGRERDADAQALVRRGYRVVLGPTEGLEAWSDASPLDALCETGGFRDVKPAERPAWAALAALRVTPGGVLFGAFAAGPAAAAERPPWFVTPSELSALLGVAFDVERLEASAFADPDGTPLLEAVFRRRRS
ncbi:MAG: hypothetical protein RLZZ299_1035 [Pseudomonadota bacterium]|jgi:hypothetical protein